MVAVSVLAGFLATTGGVLASVDGTQDAFVSPNAERRNLHRKSHSTRADNSTVLLPIDERDTLGMFLYCGFRRVFADFLWSNEALSAQIEVLNNAFEPVGFQFNLVNTTRTINEFWYNNLLEATPSERDVSAALRQGNLSTLNIYSMGVVNTTETAWATLPAAKAPYDGVFQNNTAFLGGSRPLNEGITLVHEVGHWFGLYHVFNFGCAASYDYVADTPHQQEPDAIGGCEIGRDSCPDQPGLDSIHNYMSYSDDYCRYEFTPGQIQRMREQVAKFRGIVYPGIDVDNIPEDSIEIPPPEA
ncbi:metalloprotease [Stemphylium lycopersici]|nr:metalloprotease [Stemphylium lycopersici]RAR02079.1 metalloprotease [Stemphylium lycopersici]